MTAIETSTWGLRTRGGCQPHNSRETSVYLFLSLPQWGKGDSRNPSPIILSLSLRGEQGSPQDLFWASPCPSKITWGLMSRDYVALMATRALSLQHVITLRSPVKVKHKITALSRINITRIVHVHVVNANRARGCQLKDTRSTQNVQIVGNVTSQNSCQPLFNTGKNRT